MVQGQGSPAPKGESDQASELHAEDDRHQGPPKLKLKAAETKLFLLWLVDELKKVGKALAKYEPLLRAAEALVRFLDVLKEYPKVLPIAGQKEPPAPLP